MTSMRYVDFDKEKKLAAAAAKLEALKVRDALSQEGVTAVPERAFFE